MICCKELTILMLVIGCCVFAVSETVAVTASTKSFMAYDALCSDNVELAEKMRIEQALNDL